jgi:hypothetical protein
MVIKCSDCRYIEVDKKASEYSKKRCKLCDAWENCEVCDGCTKHDKCKARQSQENKQGCGRRFETVCSKQEVKWPAIQCGNPDSEYHRSLLNITPSGEKLTRIAWSGCREGVAS